MDGFECQAEKCELYSVGNWKLGKDSIRSFVLEDHSSRSVKDVLEGRLEPKRTEYMAVSMAHSFTHSPIH